MNWYERMQANAALEIGDLWVADEAYRPVVELCRERLSTSGLPKPPGLTGGEYWLRHDVLQGNGFVRYTLWHRIGRKCAGLKLGWFVVEYLPEILRRPCKPVQTHGRQVMISVKRGECPEQRPVRVLVDGEGLPVPVPPEIWAAMGYE